MHKNQNNQTMKKIVLFLMGVGCIGLTAMAQLSIAEPTSSVIRTGNRAEAGDFGLYMGAQTSIFRKMFDRSFDLSGTLPLINLKYMQSDEIELRFGIELYRSSHRLKGSGRDSIGNRQRNFSDNIKEVEARHFFYPGIAYHFSSSNLLDVYVGAELPFGWDKYSFTDEWTNNLTNPVFNNSGFLSMQRTSWHLGLGAFIGLQAYVANLPIAIGFEYGIAAMYDFNLKTRYELRSPNNRPVVSYTPDDDFFKYDIFGGYDKLNARKSIIGSQLRFTVTYFFTN